MVAFRSDEVTFEAPEGWEDKTIVAFAGPAKPGKFAPNVVMTKDKLKPGESLRSYADRQIMELARRLDGFDLIESGERTVAGVSALEYRFSWTSEHAELHQHTIMTAPADRVFTFTGTATHDEDAALDEAMETLLRTLAFPSGSAYSPAGTGPGFSPPAAGGRGGGGGGWTPSGGGGGGGWTPSRG
jgi:hypothetical protein